MIYYISGIGEIFAYADEETKNAFGAPDLVKIEKSQAESLIIEMEKRVIVSQVSKAQGKAALIRAGLWKGVIDYVASIPDDTERALAEVALNDTTHWQRSSQFLNAAATALGLTQEQLDDLFVTAASIEL